MSIRTIVEINHDFLNEVDRDPEAAGRAVWNLLTGHESGPGEIAGFKARHFGIRKLGQRHHTDAMRLTLGGHVAHDEPEGRKR